MLNFRSLSSRSNTPGWRRLATARQRSSRWPLERRVSPESIYKGFGTKAALLKEVLDITIAGDDEPVAVADRPESQQIREEPDVRTKLRMYSQGAAARADRSARVQLAIRNGAAVDPAVNDLWQLLQAQRLTGMTMLAHHLIDTGQLSAGIEVGSGCSCR